MRRRVPPIRETVESLVARFSEESDPQRKKRIRMLYLLQLDRGMTMKEVAPALQVHRVTVGRWLKIYEHAGIEGLLAIPASPGRPAVLFTAPVLEQLREQLETPGRFRSYRDIQEWLRVTFQAEVTYKYVHKVVRHVLKTSLPSGATSG